MTVLTIMVHDRNYIKSFLQGRRLQSEIQCLAQLYDGSQDAQADLGYIQASFSPPKDPGRVASIESIEGVPSESLRLAELDGSFIKASSSLSTLMDLAISEPNFLDLFLLLALKKASNRKPNTPERYQIVYKIFSLLLRQYPERLDLLFSYVHSEGSLLALKSLPSYALYASHYYRNLQFSLTYLQSLWIRGAYEQIFTSYCQYHSSPRRFPNSDFVLRSLSIVGAMDRVNSLFKSIYVQYESDLQPPTLSNMIFTALGLEALDTSYVNQLVSRWRALTVSSASHKSALLSSSDAQTFHTDFSVQEKPILIVVSADLRLHPVGRFWLPIASYLQHRYKLIHIALSTFGNDSITQQLKNISFQWFSFDTTDKVSIEKCIAGISPHILLDLGGHTADNRVSLLNSRFAPLQLTYLGFYGPSYALHADWWLIDSAIENYISNSYPGSEPTWGIQASSLCYDPLVNGLPDVEQISYKTPSAPVFGSFNHTRKITKRCISMFASIVTSFDDSIFHIRSHSFFDQSVRKYFLREMHMAGIPAHQIKVLPYATSGNEALWDYSCISVHLDAYPVSGTTTTLDSLAMGVPVLTCPNNLYAGAISASILKNAGLGDLVCTSIDNLPQYASFLLEKYSTPESKRQLALHVRRSPVCDTKKTPEAFSTALADMLRIQMSKF